MIIKRQLTHEEIIKKIQREVGKNVEIRISKNEIEVKRQNPDNTTRELDLTEQNRIKSLDLK